VAGEIFSAQEAEQRDVRAPFRAYATHAAFVANKSSGGQLNRDTSFLITATRYGGHVHAR